MSGRAGRRGLDDKGIVILMVDEKMSPEAGKTILKVSSLWSRGSLGRIRLEVFKAVKISIDVIDVL